MLSVLRYPLEIVDHQTVLIHQPAHVISVAASRDHPYSSIDMWAVGDDNETTHPIEVFITGTGHPLPPSIALFRGTVVAPNRLVWHVWTTA